MHCHSGTGRTGIVAVLLLELAGVAEEAVAADYLASHAAGNRDAEAAISGQVLAHLREAHGGVARYLTRAGLVVDEVARLRALLRRDDLSPA